MVRCPRCGHLGKDADRFCTRCGTALHEEPTTRSLGSIETEVEGLPRPREAVLVVFTGPSAGSTFSVAGSASIGRSVSSDVFLDDVTVSRHHARITREPSGWQIEDAGSLNGTYVAGHRVGRSPLSSGEHIRIGRFVLLFRTG
jgi:FHA domain/zinc-ribbon domain